MMELGSLPEPDELSASQLEVARLVRQGLRRAEIAGVLGITPDDVSDEIEAIYETLGITDLLTLAFYVHRHRHRFRPRDAGSKSVGAAVA